MLILCFTHSTPSELHWLCLSTENLYSNKIKNGGSKQWTHKKTYKQRRLILGIIIKFILNWMCMCVCVCARMSFLSRLVGVDVIIEGAGTVHVRIYMRKINNAVNSMLSILIGYEPKMRIRGFYMRQKWLKIQWPRHDSKYSAECVIQFESYVLPN